MPDQRKLIVVLGPHRSGTSLCTAALESLGAELRLPDYYTNEENPLNEGDKVQRIVDLDDDGDKARKVQKWERILKQSVKGSS